MKRSILAALAIIIGVALAWAAPPVDKLPSLLPTPAEARNISVIVGGSPPAAGCTGYGQDNDLWLLRFQRELRIDQ